MDQPDTFVAHDGRTYQGQPPDGWRQAADGRWYPLDTYQAPPAAQWQPPARSGPPRWLWPAAAALIALAGVGAAAFFLIGQGGDEVTVFEEIVAAHEAAGCDAEIDFRGELVLYIDRFGDPSCVFRMMTTAEDLGIDLSDFTDSDDPADMLGTFEGVDYILESDVDRDGVAFAFRERQAS